MGVCIWPVGNSTFFELVLAYAFVKKIKKEIVKMVFTGSMARNESTVLI
jgi:hypothetical protein